LQVLSVLVLSSLLLPSVAYWKRNSNNPQFKFTFRLTKFKMQWEECNQL
jgi:hypothetical protein